LSRLEKRRKNLLAIKKLPHNTTQMQEKVVTQKSMLQLEVQIEEEKKINKILHFFALPYTSKIRAGEKAIVCTHFATPYFFEGAVCLNIYFF
jgi:hypothetical protein